MSVPEPRLSAVFHRRPGEQYPVFVRGEGCELWDDHGRRFLDLSSGMAWAASLGQGRQDIARRDRRARRAPSPTSTTRGHRPTGRRSTHAA